MHPFLQQLLQGQAVEWQTLGEIAFFYGGLTGKSKHDFENGNAKYITYKNIFSNLEIQPDNLEIQPDNLEIQPDNLEMVKISDNERQHQVKYGDILLTGSSEIPEEVAMSSAVTTKFDEPIYLNSLSFGIRFNDDIQITPEFAKYLFRSNIIRREIIRTANGVTRFNVSKERFKKIQIPIPPLSVQSQIVQILDTFTELNDQLRDELTAELSMRQKQYQYYRDFLLSEHELAKVGFEWKSLGEVANYEQPTKYLVKSKDYDDDFKTPVLTAGKTFILGYTNETNGIYQASKNPVIIFDDFTTANKWVDFDFKAKSSAMKMISSADENQFLLKYIYYWLNTLPSGLVDGDHKRQWISNFANKKIPIPPLSVQSQIVAILDTFDTLTQSISEGLPKEIQLRQKQYEYYRELLLDFDAGDGV
ncbi:restriction endonuclease subunit S [Moraxella catarrhalis]|uniref:restriction endonuclease subunit S n=1 Tax=Moraxella catarrhalis TaxID=480 RepID=UPI0007E2F1C8|nr:restriction endonuclease subunit S [Moraxella catarrhalis]OAV16001.1 Type I restriction-modification system, specificity subunit S [Moraxella catarrhalis]OAV16996.1 Type I restriction-modification system, specificity subunit S [Moraxella catarrhalis]